MKALPRKASLTGVVLALVLTTAVGSSAHETQSFPDHDYCYYGRVCLYQHHNYGGGKAFYTGSDADYFYDVFSNSTSLDNNVSTVWNNGSSCTVYLRGGYDFGGWQWATSLGQAWNLNGTQADDASSHHWCSPS